MPNEEDEERLLRSVALENAKSILFARQRAERALLEANEALELKTQELSEANRRLSESEALYRSALSAGRMGTWETDLVARTRQWTPEGMALFGIKLPDGRGNVGGDHGIRLQANYSDPVPVNSIGDKDRIHEKLAVGAQGYTYPFPLQIRRT